MNTPNPDRCDPRRIDEEVRARSEAVRAPVLAPEIERRDDGTFVFTADGVEIEWPLATTCARFPVQPDFYGFEIASTGGGCTAWARDFTYKGRRVCMLITNADSGHEVSDDDAAIVLGVYEDGECLCTWSVSQGEGDYPRSEIDRADGMPEGGPADALRRVLSSEWCGLIAARCNQGGKHGDLLAWPADSACGLAVQQITRLADQVRGEWPDQKDEVVRLALRQISIVCWG
jgi:hypothetical protein